MLGGTLKHLGRIEEAERVLREALEVSLALGPRGSPWAPLHALGELERDRGDLVAARELLERAVAASKERGEWEHDHASIRHGLGDLALDEGSSKEARAWYLEALGVAREHDAFYTTIHCVAGLAAAAAVEKRLERAADLWAATERYSELRGVELGATERERYLNCISAVSPELLAAARDRWEDATPAAVEEAAATAVD
jgi:tetratricopeptide (TPR) repeat protein